MTDSISVLFVCTHNSARSIMAEALLRDKGGDAYEVVSAGTETATVRPLTLRVLEEAGLPTQGLRSKSVTEFMGRRFDYVITVCDAARQACPVFRGEGERLHWSYPDPSVAEGTDDERLVAGIDLVAFASRSWRSGWGTSCVAQLHLDVHGGHG